MIPTTAGKKANWICGPHNVCSIITYSKLYVAAEFPSVPEWDRDGKSILSYPIRWIKPKKWPKVS